MDMKTYMYTISALFVVSALINFIVLFAYQRLETKAKRFKKTEEEINIDSVTQYLEEQFKQTKGLLPDKRYQKLPFNVLRGANFNHIVALRSAYLRLERKAIPKGISSWEYNLFIIEKLATVLKIYMPSLFENKNLITKMDKQIANLKDKLSESTKKIESYSNNPAKHLADFEKLCSNNTLDPEAIQPYMKKLEKIIYDFSDPASRQDEANQTKLIDSSKNIDQAYERLSSNVDKQTNEIIELGNVLGDLDSADNEDLANSILQDLTADLSKTKSNNVHLKEDMTDLKDKISSISTKLSKSSSGTTLGARISVSRTGEDDDDSELKTLSDEIQEINAKEIDRLRNMVKDQKSSIFGMESKITTLESELTDKGEISSETQSLIDQLKATIAESEMCIQVLEQEMTQMKSQLDTMEEEKVAPPPDVSEKDIEMLNNRLDSLNKELTEKVSAANANEIINNYVKEAITASTIEDISLLIFDCIQQTGGDPHIAIQCKGKDVIVSQSGKIANREKILIDNMQLNEINESNNHSSISFRFSNIRGTIKALEDGELFKINRKSIIEIARISNDIIGKILAVQQAKENTKKIEDCKNTVRKAAADLDKLYNSNSDKTKDIISSSLGQVEDIARTFGIPDNKIQTIKSIEEDAIATVNADKVLQLSARKQFVSIISDLDRLKT